MEEQQDPSKKVMTLLEYRRWLLAESYAEEIFDFDPDDVVDMIASGSMPSTHATALPTEEAVKEAEMDQFVTGGPDSSDEEGRYFTSGGDEGYKTREEAYQAYLDPYVADRYAEYVESMKRRG